MSGAKRSGWGRVGAALRAPLLAISTYIATARDVGVRTLDDEAIERARGAYGGQLSLQPTTRTRWYHRDLEVAEYQADAGDMQRAGELCRTLDRDGVLKGVLSTRCGGLVRLPKRFRAASTGQDMVDALQAGGEQARSVFDEMCPATELEIFVEDFVKLNVAVAELVEVEGRAYPVLVRRLPEFLVYNWTKNRWYFRSAFGLIEVTPGDGRWVLLLGGREAPWQHGTWKALSRAFITKDHARSQRDNWESKLANAARVALAPAGATEGQRRSWFAKVAAWGINTVFALLPGWDVKLLESNGRGGDTFRDTIAEQNQEIIMTVSGQTVTADGGVGFANADVFDSIKADLIQRDGDALAHCLNTQVIPAWTINTYGPERLAESPTVSWDTTPPTDQKESAEALSFGAKAITDLSAALATSGLVLDVKALCVKWGIPLSLSAAAPAVQPIEAPVVEEPAGAQAFARRLRSISAQNRMRLAA